MINPVYFRRGTTTRRILPHICSRNIAQIMPELWATFYSSTNQYSTAGGEGNDYTASAVMWRKLYHNFVRWVGYPAVCQIIRLDIRYPERKSRIIRQFRQGIPDHPSWYPPQPYNFDIPHSWFMLLFHFCYFVCFPPCRLTNHDLRGYLGRMFLCKI